MKKFEGELKAKGLKFAIIVSRFNEFITSKLLDGAVDALLKHGSTEQDIEVIHVPGSFEIPIAAKKVVEKKSHDAVICLGAIIRGATPHFEYIASEVARGISAISLEAGIPIAFGVITANTIEQAMERSGTKSSNKGWEAAIVAIEMAQLLKKL